MTSATPMAWAATVPSACRRSILTGLDRPAQVWAGLSSVHRCVAASTSGKPERTADRAEAHLGDR